MKKLLSIRKHILFVSNFLIILIIIVCFTAVVYRDTKAYQALAEKHTKNIVSLADLNISKYIENTMTKPVMVSKTMANDEFLKSWLTEETQNFDNDIYLTKLYTYLKTYQKKYDYSTVFCVSSATDHYYYQNGLNKTVSKEDPHDIWYYNFIDSGREYDLQIDTNEANKDTITVFVNFRIESDTGQLLGIIGVGLEVDSLEYLVHSYEKNYDLSIYIINSGGAPNSFSGTTNLFLTKENLKKVTGVQDEIKLVRSNEPQMQWFTSNKTLKCLVTKYDSTLGWYLIVEKDTASIRNAFQERIKNNIFFMLISLATCVMIITIIFNHYNTLIITNENKDELTGLSNPKLFAKQFTSFMHKMKSSPKTLFMFDIDHFKFVNDTYGHIYGNSVLRTVSEKLEQITKDHGIVSRWGGDEFLGVLALSIEDSKHLLQELMESLSQEEKMHYCITISIGITQVNQNLNLDQMIKMADTAMYHSKENGRNQISVYFS